MRLFTSVAALGCYFNLLQIEKIAAGEPPPTIGLVPTMGSLHGGHLSLIERARAENTIAIVSIFVNPLQFGPNEDFQEYPRQLESDRQLCETAGVDVIFAPSPEEMGFRPTTSDTNTQSSFTTVVPPASMTSIMCALSRPGHFEGVATAVTKLLSLVRPTRAYLGQKDAQQLAIIKRLVADLNLPVEIVGCPIVREPSGLALSSRNQYLTPEQKEQAAVLYRAISRGEEVFCQNRSLPDNASKILEAVKAELAAVPEVEVEYVELVDPDSLQPLEKVERVGLLAIAARIGSCRLIDNMLLKNRQPIIAIDGPAGAGKSTVTKLVAKELGLLYLDTGAMYRAVTWLVLQSGIAIDDEPAIADEVSKCQISFTGGSNFKITINGKNVTEAIRTTEVTSHVSAIAAMGAVRYFLVKKQQEFGKTGGIVAEGRDIGTRVFPDAEVKIFLTASVKERSRRRLEQLQKQGEQNISLEQLERDISQRDLKDSTRKVSPLRQAADAIVLETDGLSIAEVTQKIVKLYQRINN
ncbi:MAG: bifunctional pantoate--beta-alanine ligase/(d)CMP kinase [Cyanobacteriota bacterium]|nr:bifunctional pantoate--beta-alanine ligase/(d)CMP kinase [Cyanobacteriota bacterium]